MRGNAQRQNSSVIDHTLSTTLMATYVVILPLLAAFSYFIVHDPTLVIGGTFAAAIQVPIARFIERLLR